MADLPKLLFCSACGMLFGFAMEKGRVYEPSAIRLQMSLDRFVMMKMFLSAVASGMVCMSFLSILRKSEFQEVERRFRGEMTGIGEVSALLGGAVLGAGMTLAGSCPGMVLVQVGAGVTNAVYTACGGLAGALAYGILEPFFRRLFDHRASATSDGCVRGHNTSYMSAALPMAAVFGCAVFALESMYAWRGEISYSASYPRDLFTSYAWPPYVAGALVGALQVPVILAGRQTLGSSGAYRTIAAQTLLTNGLRRELGHLNRFRTGLENWAQVAYVVGAIGGGYLSASYSGSLNSVKGVPFEQAALGGFLMVFGASFASGCTSGHGLSGMALFNLKSVIAVAAMFAGGMATRHFYPGL